MFSVPPNLENPNYKSPLSAPTRSPRLGVHGAPVAVGGACAALPDLQDHVRPRRLGVAVRPALPQPVLLRTRERDAEHGLELGPGVVHVPAARRAGRPYRW